MQTTNYPWEGVRDHSRWNWSKPRRFDLHLRIPGWCRGPGLAVNGQPPDAAAEKGYVAVTRQLADGRRGAAGPADARGASLRRSPGQGRRRAAWRSMRGPVVYCLEGADNDGRRPQSVPAARCEAGRAISNPTCSAAWWCFPARRCVSRGEDDKLATVPARFIAVPYSTWDNREPGEMVVWLPESPELAEIPGEDGVVSGGIRVRGSHCNPSDTLAALNDAVLPKSSGDHELPRMTWWDRLGTKEWVSYRFPQPRRFRPLPSTGSTTPAADAAAFLPSGGCCGWTATNGSPFELAGESE